MQYNKTDNVDPKWNKPTSGKETLRDKAGDALEKAGHKISESGAPKVGQKIHDWGDKLEEHHDNPAHPHKT